MSKPEPEATGPSDHIARNVQVAAEIHARAERELSSHQRGIERATARLGRPASIYAVLAIVAAWVTWNVVAPHLGVEPFDPAPFAFLQTVIGLVALMVSLTVLATQMRQAKISERRMHLDLQVNLLAEQKVAKLIELVEELRRDLPNVHDRRDSEAEAMTQPAEPLEVIAAIAQTLEAVQEAHSESEVPPSSPRREDVPGHS